MAKAALGWALSYALESVVREFVNNKRIFKFLAKIVKEPIFKLKKRG
jgi:hypothetical protein